MRGVTSSYVGKILDLARRLRHHRVTLGIDPDISRAAAFPALTKEMVMSRPRALVLTGSLGMGHHVVTEVVADSLEQMGWSTSVFDCMSMLGRLSGKTGDWVFRRITATPTLYDGVHFSHFRTGSRLAPLVDWGATNRLVPARADP